MMGAIGMLFPPGPPPGSSVLDMVAALFVPLVCDIGIEFGPRPSLFKPNILSAISNEMERDGGRRELWDWVCVECNGELERFRGGFVSVVCQCSCLDRVYVYIFTHNRLYCEGK